ncbi:MAG: GNAT family N-acetyltransferase [Bacteroidales bacterium]|nr:GNAT family N-acetyltransferase [Bacteroidales bacterium]
MKTLENSTIRLRSIETEDIDFLYQTENNIDLWEISNIVSPYSKHTLEKYIQNTQDIFSAKQVRFIIETTVEKKVVGMIDLFNYDPIHLRAEIGINIINNEKRKKFAENALIVLKEYCIHILRLTQVYCNISADNIASVNLFKKAGFKQTGKKEQWLNTSEGFKDVLFFQLIFD